MPPIPYKVNMTNQESKTRMHLYLWDILRLSRLLKTDEQTQDIIT